MKLKKLLRFYFSAGNLDKLLNNIILNLAVGSGRDVNSGGEIYADKICGVIEIKAKLSDLWARIDGVMQKLTDRDRATLKVYARLRRGPSGDEIKEIHRAAVKFARKAGRRFEAAGEEYKMLCAYYCVLVEDG